MAISVNVVTRRELPAVWLYIRSSSVNDMELLATRC
ncbi:predicted protein [Sclerotinia sclerotiorum 1980 UF-70]|uniref:Uncharacterized protein n=1 Tax=Sclerotinia sclerotiorum (strain ATCC 18683 / 1980 / Ss-1) TaxID=665079 RepID=A7EMS8_SCLS1|nr:predicted protein [Sclerotinia sclerotiorum 1980 UF-70]EDO04144.1 predicted protein [Sclerotinia sclerotiorum 1980 UF-70]